MDLNTWASNVWPNLHVTKKTLRNYEGAYTRHLAATLGHIDLGAISRSQLINAIDRCSPASRYQTLMVSRVLFREAIRHELIDESPATGIPSLQPTPNPQPFLTWEKLRSVDFGTQTERIRFLALHGLRYGEAAILSIDDIRDGRVYINKSIHGNTKTKAGIRSVPLLSPFVPFAKYQNTIAGRLKPLGVTVHSLRKTYAYLLKNADIHVTTASKLMGHSNPLVTLKIYTAVLDEEIDEVGISLSRILK